MKEVKLREICRIEKGKQIDTSQLRTDSPYKYINGGIKESGYYHEYNTDSEAVLVSEGGASCGYVNYVNEKFWCGCHCYKLTESKTLAKYLYYALKGNQDKIMELRSGAAMPNIKKEVFKNMSLLVDFDKNNQQAIVETLDCIQKAINNKTDELSSLDELVKSRFIEMFGHYFEDSRYFVKVGDIATATIGLTYKPDNVTDEGIIVLRSGNIQNAELCLSDDIVRVSNIKIKEDIERQSNVCFSGRDNRHNIGKISCVCAPTFRALLIGENFYEGKVLNGCRVPAHFEPVVEKVILLVCFKRAFLDFFQFKIVAALFTHFGYKHNTELKTAVVDIIRNDLSPKT